MGSGDPRTRNCRDRGGEPPKCRGSTATYPATFLPTRDGRILLAKSSRRQHARTHANRVPPVRLSRGQWMGIHSHVMVHLRPPYFSALLARLSRREAGNLSVIQHSWPRDRCRVGLHGTVRPTRGVWEFWSIRCSIATASTGRVPHRASRDFRMEALCVRPEPGTAVAVVWQVDDTLARSFDRTGGQAIPLEVYLCPHFSAICPPTSASRRWHNRSSHPAQDRTPERRQCPRPTPEDLRLLQ